MRRTTFIIVVVVALITAGCAKAAEQVAEQVAEHAIESESGGDVDVNLGDDGQATIEFSDDEGGGTITIGGGEIPEDFPVPFPDGGTVVQTMTGPGGGTVTVTYEDRSYDELVAFYADWVKDRGEVSKIQTSEGGQRSTSWIGDQFLVVVADTGEGTVSVTATFGE